MLWGSHFWVRKGVWHPEETCQSPVGTWRQGGTPRPPAGSPSPAARLGRSGGPAQLPPGRGNPRGHGTALRRRGESAELPEQGRRPAGIFLAKLEVKQRWELGGIQEAPASPAASMRPHSRWLGLQLSLRPPLLSPTCPLFPKGFRGVMSRGLPCSALPQCPLCAWSNLAELVQTPPCPSLAYSLLSPP